MSLEKIKARRAERKNALAKLRAEQYEKDLEELDKLEELHGHDAVLSVELIKWSPGATTMIVVKLPKTSEQVYKRFQHQANAKNPSASHKVDASDMLARSCAVYPHPKEDTELFDATIDIAPGLLGYVAQQIVDSVQGKAEEEGK